MDHSTDKIHVLPIPGGWEIEAQSGTQLGRAAAYDEALSLARRAAQAAGVSWIVVHDGDGVTREVAAGRL